MLQGSNFSQAVVEGIVTVQWQHRDPAITCTEHCLLLTSKYTHSDLQVKMSGMFILRISDGYI